MRKKIVAILLAVCLAVGCLPAPASAAQLTGNKEELISFLEKLYVGLNFFEFDAEKTTVENVLIGPWDNILFYLLYRHPYEDSIYPGENIQCINPYIDPDDTFDWGSDWSTIPQNPDFIPDPLGRFSTETINDYYFKINETKFDWIMENIFNISTENISTMKSELDTDFCYCHEGYYYMQVGGAGGGALDNFAISRMEPKGNLFYVTCDLYWEGNAFFIVEPKTIDGNVYWTLHYANRMDIIDGIPTLPKGFNPTEFGYNPDLPPNITRAGVCGENTSWTLDKNDTLTISGQGKIIAEIIVTQLKSKIL